MVKCVVSGCPSRVLNVNRGLFKRPPKRFFSFPKDPARVKVWLAALREMNKQDSTERHLICEDHFLPEDVSTDGVKGDAIPIMPPYLDGPMGMISPWGAESSEEEGQWATGGGDDDDEGGDDGPANTQPPAPEPPALVPSQPEPGSKKASGAKRTISLTQRKDTIQTKRANRQDMSLGALTQRFLQLLLAAPGGSLDLRQATATLQTRRRRVYDITNVLEGINLIEKESTNKCKWIGRCQISNFLFENQHTVRRELEEVKLVEDMLDTLIKSCAQQLFDVTDDLENAALAYLTHEDIRRLAAFQEQTVIVVKAPEETKLEVPAPKENSIQVHLKGGKGPIMVLTCDLGTGDETGEQSGCFLTMEESQIETAALHTSNNTAQR